MSVPSTRRSLLKKGALGGALLFVGGTLSVVFRPSGPMRTAGRTMKILTPEEFGIFAAAAARIVPGDLAPEAWRTADQVDCAGRLDEILATLHPRAANEFQQLLRLFENAITGLAATGRAETFTAASPEAQDRRLQVWRNSRVSVLRSGYQAIKRLAHATYFSSPQTYAAVGYPGPPTVTDPDSTEPGPPTTVPG